MADISRRLETNVDGDFFVDSSCINCGTCRWMAPTVFNQHGNHSRVLHQPRDEAEVLASLRALVACPVASIGTVQRHDIASVAASFPIEIASSVYHCGYHHRNTYGATSYFIIRPQGNILVDSPRFSSSLVKRIDELGGVRLMFLTHRDDVADHEKFATRFGCNRILHADDVSASTRGVEIQFQGEDAYRLDGDLLIIPVPGHTRGSCCLLYEGQFLFTGDHLAWNISKTQLYAFRDVCWFNWSTQIESMTRLARYDFQYVLPGHGAPCHFDTSTMRKHMRACLEWMATA